MTNFIPLISYGNNFIDVLPKFFAEIDWRDYNKETNNKTFVNDHLQFINNNKFLIFFVNEPTNIYRIAFSPNYKRGRSGIKWVYFEPIDNLGTINKNLNDILVDNKNKLLIIPQHYTMLDLS